MITDFNQKIFIVDDDPFWSALLKEILNQLGYKNITCFESGKSCMANLNLKPEIIFLDYQMTGVDGISTLKGIKNYYSTATVVFTTSTSDIKVAVNAMKYGAFDYLLKSNVTKNEVEAILNTIKDSMVSTERIY
jgi:DNA-binding NtrC family response regulator